MRLAIFRQLYGVLLPSALLSKPCDQMHNQWRFFRICVNLHLDKNSGSSKQNENKTATDEDDDYDAEKDIRKEKRISTQTFFDSKEKNKATFNTMIDIYKERMANRRGHVEFIYAAMKHLEEFGVDYDLQTYKNIISIIPEEKYVPQNLLQQEFVHYPYQQYCIIDLLDHMEGKGICPDREMMEMLARRFGKEGHPVRKVGRMMYWMSKMKNATPWPVPLPPPKDPFTLAKLAIERIVTVDPQSEVSVYQANALPEAIDHTYIVSGISPTQKQLIKEHPKSKPIYVEGGFRIWLRTANITYFILRTESDLKEIEPNDPDDFTDLKSPIFYYKEPKKLITAPSVHEQEDGTILAVCATGTSSRDSLLSWVRLLEQDGNPALADIPILFTLKSPLGDVIPVNDGPVPPPDDELSKKIASGE